MRRFIAIALVLVSSAATSAAWATPISDKYAQLGGAGRFPRAADHRGNADPRRDGGLKVVVSYSGGWSVPTSGGSIGGESGSFGLPADTSTIVPVNLKVVQVPK